MKRAMGGVLLVAIAAAQPAAAEGGGPDILEILDAFVLARVAAGECEQPSKDTLRDFLANFQTVATFARRELNDRFPERSHAEVTSAFKQRSAALTRQVRAVVANDGCDAPRVRALVRRFYVSAEWNPGR